MTLRFHEIAESRHRILNPLSAEKLRLIGRICTAAGPTRILDLCCGKAEMLCTWAAEHDVSGIGVDISEVFLAAAHQRAVELGVDDRVTLVHADATAYAAEVDEQFDLVSCIGATWIGNGLVGTLELMRPRMKSGGLIAVGEPYWIDPLPAGVSVLGIADEDYVSLAGTHERCEGAGFDLVEMVLSNTDDWDRYVAAQWSTVDEWLRQHPEDQDAGALDEWIRAGRRSYLGVDRRYLGWGVFVLRSKR
ncbi:MAG: methyltransferase domain-containing protein [Ilumatobacteraceae bacterium]|nr:methyltransferase domain-containing protein [Ilumatobacteraceae bacterium]